MTSHGARIKLLIPHLVRCAHCSAQYIYELEYTGLADGFASPEIAEEKARENLQKELNDLNRFDTVPCPECFKYQPHMCWRIAREHYDGLHSSGCCVAFFLGPLALIAAGVLFAVIEARQEYVIAALTAAPLLLVAGIAMMGRARQKARRYEPNEDGLDERQKRARDRATSPREYDLRQTSRVRKAYQQHDQNPPRNAKGQVKKFITDWYLSPSALIEGGSFTITLSDQDAATVDIPDKVDPGDAVTTQTSQDKTIRVHLLAMRVHPDEYRLEEEPA